MDAINWTRLGTELRAAGKDATAEVEGVDFPPISIAYEFLLENPECFGREEWPSDMPQEPNIKLIAAYYGATSEARQ